MPPGDFSPPCFPQPSRSCLPPVCSKCRFTRVNHEYRQSCQSVFQQYLRREKKQVVGVGGVQMQLVNVLSKPTVFMSQWSWQSVSLWTLTTRVKTEDESSHTSLNRVSSRPTMAGFLMIEIEGHTAVPSHTHIQSQIHIKNTNSGFRSMPGRQRNWWPEWPEGHLWLPSCVYPHSLSVCWLQTTHCLHSMLKTTSSWPLPQLNIIGIDNKFNPRLIFTKCNFDSVGLLGQF